MTSRPWYAHFPGDYARKTAHLSMVEHGAYRLLLDHYYSTAIPLPSDHQNLYRICRAFSPEECAAIDKILSDFFVLRHGKYHNVRADSEIEEAERLHKIKAQAGRAGGIAARGKSGRKPNSSEIAEPIANELQKNTPSPSQSHNKKIDTNVSTKEKRAKQIPDGFPDEQAKEWARQFWASKGRSDLDADEEAVKFQLHAKQNGKTYKSWLAAWQMWCHNAIKFNRPPLNGFTNVADEGMKLWEEEMRRDGKL